MMTAARQNYRKCLSTSCVICRHVTIFSENIQNEWRKLSQDVLNNYIWHILHKLPYDRRRKAYRLSQTRKRSFQHTAFFLWSVNSPPSIDVHSGALHLNLQLHPTTTLFPKAQRGPMIAHTCSPLFAFKTPRISKFSWSWVKESLTLPNLQYRDL